VLAHAGREAQRQVGQSPDIDVDDAELFGPVEFDRLAEQAEAGIVDEILDFDVCRAKRRFDLVDAPSAPGDDRSRRRRAPVRCRCPTKHR
jgi:hypothetical protein